MKTADQLYQEARIKRINAKTIEQAIEAFKIGKEAAKVYKQEFKEAIKEELNK